MRLLQLKLENFRQHGDSTIEFRDGMTAIVGPNGSGKSTVLEAITFALYGEKRGDKSTVRFFWAPPRRPFRVTLTFDLDGKRMVAERGETDAMLRHLDGGKEHVFATGLKSVNHACEKLTGLSYEQFTNSFCAEQKGLAFLDFKTSVARQDEIARMLGYDRLKLAADVGKDRVRGLRIRISALQENLGSEDQFKAEVAAAATGLRQATETVKTSDMRLAELDKSLPKHLAARQSGERYLALVQEARAIAATADGLKSAAKTTEEALEKARLDAKELSRLRPLDNQYRKAEADLRALDALRERHLAREQKVARLKELEDETAAVCQQLEELGAVDLTALSAAFAEAAERHDAAHKALRTAEDRWREDRQNAAKLLAAIDERLKEAERQVARAREMIARGICPECGQATVESGAEALKKRQSEAAERKKERDLLVTASEKFAGKPSAILELEAALATALAVLESGRRAEAEGKQFKVKRDAVQENLNRLAKASESLAAELKAAPSAYDSRAHESAKAACEAMKPDHAAFLRVEHADKAVLEWEAKHEKAHQELTVARAKYKTLEDERKGLGFAGLEEAQQAVQAHTELLTERRMTERDLANAIQRRDDFAARLKEKEGRLADFHQKRAAIQRDRDELALHETTAKELLALRENLNEGIRPELEARASDNLALLTHDRYSVLRLAEDFQALVVEDEIDKPVISGGEEDVVALSLRLALSELIQERQGRPMSLLILDEVFGSLDSERRQSVLERLGSIKGRFAQILVISHIEEINQVADQCLYVSRDGGTRAARVTDAPPEFVLTSLEL